MYGPISPRTKAMGMMAAITAKVARMVGLPTSSTASTATPNRAALVFRQAKVADDVLHNDDGIINQNADGENQGKEGDAVKGVAIEIEDRQGQGQGDRNGDGHDPRLPEAQGDQIRTETERMAISMCQSNSLDFSLAVSP